MSIDRDHPAVRMNVAEQRAFVKECIGDCTIETLEKIVWSLCSERDPATVRDRVRKATNERSPYL